MADAHDQIRIAITGGALRNDYLPLGGHLDFFPSESYGGEAKQDAGSPVTLEFESLPDPVLTDIVEQKARFRDRAGWRAFFAASNADPGETVVIQRVERTRFRVLLDRV